MSPVIVGGWWRSRTRYDEMDFEERAARLAAVRAAHPIVTRTIQSTKPEPKETR